LVNDVGVSNVSADEAIESKLSTMPSSDEADCYAARVSGLVYKVLFWQLWAGSAAEY
jgi:hypothetical protein